MFSPCYYLLLCVVPILYSLQSCASEPIYPPTLMLYSPGDPEYTDVLVKREHDNLTLVCELSGDNSPRSYVWNYVNNGTTGQRPYTVDPLGLTTSSRLSKQDLQLSDSGEYMCSAPPFSVTKYILVQTKGPVQCARGAFWCGARCVLAAYVCDGRADCARAEDERPALCPRHVCARSDKLNCSSGRCISARACCRAGAPLCRQPACCDEYPTTRQLGIAEEYPPLFEDRHAPDDYGFIQSTIYTVTACALIFMIAVVLLVSAICKMHMKRAALRGYTHAERATRHHYTMQYAQAHRFPPCYEASRLLEENRTSSPQQSPVHVATPPEIQCNVESPMEPPRGLARLSSIFSSRYRQVPTQPEPVELVPVRARSLQGSPRRPLPDYRSPAACAGAADEADLRDAPPLGRELNYMATPIEFFRRRTMRRNTLERVIDQLDRQRLTLQLGRFQLSIPRFGRTDPRPDTPNVAEINIDDLDFVRLNSNETYTLNGRTIRLLGADFENYPDGSVGPPSYTEAVRYKLYGPPPEYLSREGLNRRSVDTVDQEATSNVEMPPCYEDLGAGNDDNGNVNRNNGGNGVNCNVIRDNDVNAIVNTDNGSLSINANVVAEFNGINGNFNGVNGIGDVVNGNCEMTEENRLNAATNAAILDIRNNVSSTQNDESPVETLSSIIDNLPAIDSDINANDTDIVSHPVNQITFITGNDISRSIDNVTANNVENTVGNNVNNNVICNNE